jgi:hypothetical protein
MSLLTVSGSDLQNPFATSERLGKKAPIFQRAPILESQCSQVLRLANVQHVIFDVICDDLWQPFLSEHLLGNPKAHSVIKHIYSRLAAEGDQVQRNWKVSTLRSLNQLDVASDFSSCLDLFVGGVIDTLRPLLDDRQVSKCQGDLRQQFIEAIAEKLSLEEANRAVVKRCTLSDSSVRREESAFVQFA